jgi:hypothetical protein
MSAERQPLQQNMFSGEWVDNRTNVQKKGDRSEIGKML